MTICFDQLRLAEPSPAARRLLWHVLSIGRVWRDEPETHVDRDKAGMFLFWVVSGRGSLQVRDRHWPLAAGHHCWLMDLSAPRGYIPDSSKRLVTSGVRFSGPGWESWCASLGGTDFFPLGSVSAMAALRRDQNRLVRLVTRRPASHEWQVHEILTRLLGQLLAVRKVFVTTSDHDTPLPVTRVLDAVLADPARAWRAAELAKIAAISYSGLRAMFRTAQQESLSEFLQRTRLDQARLLLADDRLPIKHIAQCLNFSSEFYFSNWFRRLAGTSPTTFRAGLRE
jgi:AraC-like DNA-binding protein